MNVILSPNPYRDKGLKAVREARHLLEQYGVETRICLPFQPEIGYEIPEDIRLENIRQAAEQADLLICFGGDGTILHSAKLAAEYHIPILGVNMGSVGFMAELEHSELKLLHRLVEGQYTCEKRMLMDVKVLRDKRVIYQDTALNDVTITRGAIAAGGPIVEPTAENLIITPICAHALQAKSFVLGPERVVAVRTSRQSRKTAYLSSDGGRAFRLNGGDVVEMCNSKRHIELVRLSGRNFYEIVSQKLGRN